jgi:hypothetical protein
MAVTGAWAADMFDGENRGFLGGGEGTFNTPAQTFPQPVNILAIPILQFIGETDDNTSVRCFISEFTDNGVKHQGTFVGVAATKCTEIVWSLYCRNCVARACRLILFLG